MISPGPVGRGERRLPAAAGRVRLSRGSEGPGCQVSSLTELALGDPAACRTDPPAVRVTGGGLPAFQVEH